MTVNNDNQVVSVFANGTDLYYVVGTIDTADQSISWGPTTKYDSGEWPDASLTEDGRVVTVHQSQHDSKLYTNFGTLNGGLISLGSSSHFDNGASPTRVSSNSAMAMEVHANQGKLSLYYSTGDMPS